MASPGGPNIIPSPRAPSIAPSIRSASSINHALLYQLALPSPSPGKAPASLTSALQDVLRCGSTLNFHSARRSGGQVKVPYAFPLNASQRAKAEMEQNEQRVKNLVVLALVLVTAGSIGQYCAAAEAGADARMYAGVMARVAHKREWDIACLEESGKAREMVRHAPSSDSSSNHVSEDETDEPPRGFPCDEEEIPHLVELEVKHDQIESDVSWCFASARAAMVALESGLKWFEDKSPAGTQSEETSEHDDDGTASQASNPFLASSEAKPKPTTQSSPARGAEEEEHQSSLEQLNELLQLFSTAAQLSLFIPYVSGDFDTPDTTSSSAYVPIKLVLNDERERMKIGLPVDRARVKRELGKAGDKARKSEKQWNGRRDDAARRAITCLASAAGAIDAALEGYGEEFEGVDGRDSDDSEEEGVVLKAVLIATLGVAQVTLVACHVSDKWLVEAHDYTRSYPSSFTIPSSSEEPASREKLVAEAAQTQKENRMARAGREREAEKGRRNVRASLGKVVCQMLSGVWKSLAPETQTGEWESELAFWSDMEGLEVVDGDGDAQGGGNEGKSGEGKEFDELERRTLAALKLLGLGTFKLFDNLFKGTEEWQRENPVHFMPQEDENAENDEEDEDDVEPLGPERMGKLSGEEKISSWLISVTSSPKSTPEDLDAEGFYDGATNGTTLKQPLPFSPALQMIADAKQRGQATLITLQRQIAEENAQLTKDEEELKEMEERDEREQREYKEEVAKTRKELEEPAKLEQQAQERVGSLKRRYSPSGGDPEEGEEEPGAKEEVTEKIPTETGDEGGDKENIPAGELPRPVKKQKQSTNAKVASMWKPKKRLSKARESIALRKQQQIIEERARAERDKAREEEGKKNEPSGEAEMGKKKQGATKAKRKGRSKAQKEAARVKRAQGRAGQA